MTTAEHTERTMAEPSERAEAEYAGVRHPLDPLTAEEIEAASRILTRDRGLAASARFVYITLREPAKDAVLRYRRGSDDRDLSHAVALPAVLTCVVTNSQTAASSSAGVSSWGR